MSVELLTKPNEFRESSPEQQQEAMLSFLRQPRNSSEREFVLKSEQFLNGTITKEVNGQMVKINTALQAVHTPFDLCEKMIEKLYNYIDGDKINFPFGLKGKKILVYNVEFLEILFVRGILWENEVWLVNDNHQKVGFANRVYIGDSNLCFFFGYLIG